MSPPSIAPLHATNGRHRRHHATLICRFLIIAHVVRITRLNLGIGRVRGLGGALLLAQKCCQFRIADADATFLVEKTQWTDHILWY